jgi:hypothetical protein
MSMPSSNTSIECNIVLDEPIIQIDSRDDSTLPKSIYFGGSAFGSAFYSGVYKAMVQKWGPNFFENCIFLGDSAGSVWAMGIALGRSPDLLDELFRAFVMKTYTNGTFGKVNFFMEESVRQIIGDDETAYKRLENRCFIGTTSFFDKHSWTHSFESNEHLICTLLHSCRIPLYFGKNNMLTQCKIDGAYSLSFKDLPNGNSTLFIRTDDSVADITCTTIFLETFWPIIGAHYDELSRKGENSMLSWNGTYVKKDSKQNPHYGIMFVLWCMYAVESIISFFAIIHIYKN